MHGVRHNVSWPTECPTSTLGHRVAQNLQGGQEINRDFIPAMNTDALRRLLARHHHDLGHLRARPALLVDPSASFTIAQACVRKERLEVSAHS